MEMRILKTDEQRQVHVLLKDCQNKLIDADYNSKEQWADAVVKAIYEMNVIDQIVTKGRFEVLKLEETN